MTMLTQLGVFDLAELRRADAQAYELLLEVCSGRTALASVLMKLIAAAAVDRALAWERDRIEAHLLLAEGLGLRGAEIASRALRAGACFDEEALEEYRQADKERRQNKTLTLVAQDRGNSAC